MLDAIPPGHAGPGGFTFRRTPMLPGGPIREGYDAVAILHETNGKEKTFSV